MAAPTGYSSLGLIGFTDKGDYVAATTYVQNDLCHYNGKIWKSKADDNTGHTPASGAYWDIWVDPSDSLEEMTDVDISSPANGDVLEYDSTSGKWKNSDVIGEVKQALSDEVEVRAEYTVHNFLDVLGSTKTNVSVSSANNRVITNTATDTKSALSLTFTFKYSDGTSSSPIWQDVSGTGEKTFTITATKDVTEVVFTHNGSVRNIGFKTSCSLKAGSYILSFSITSNDPTTVGGLVIEKAILADAKDSYTGYTPYAMTNRELTDAVEQTNERYMITELNHAVSVTADGVKTFKELIQALYTATVSWVNSNLTANEWVEFHQLDYNSGGMLFTPKRVVLWGKNSVQRIEFVLINLDSSGNTEIALMVLGEASADFKYVAIASGTYNYSSRNTDVVPSGNVLSVSFKRFTKIAF